MFFHETIKDQLKQIQKDITEFNLSNENLKNLYDVLTKYIKK